MSAETSLLEAPAVAEAITEAERLRAGAEGAAALLRALTPRGQISSDLVTMINDGIIGGKNPSDEEGRTKNGFNEARQYLLDLETLERILSDQARRLDAAQNGHQK